MFQRVETAFPLRDPKLAERVVQESFNLAFDDNRQAWLLQGDGTYRHAWPENNEPEQIAQETLMQLANDK